MPFSCRSVSPLLSNTSRAAPSAVTEESGFEPLAVNRHSLHIPDSTNGRIWASHQSLLLGPRARCADTGKAWHSIAPVKLQLAALFGACRHGSAVMQHWHTTSEPLCHQHGHELCLASIPTQNPTLQGAQAQRCCDEALGHHYSILCHVRVEVRRQVEDCVVRTPHNDGAEASVVHCLGGWSFCGGDGADASGAVGPAVTDRAGQGWGHMSRRAQVWFLRHSSCHRARQAYAVQVHGGRSRLLLAMHC